jgi:signal transduction histidine kinase
MARLRDYPISTKLTWINVVVSSTALLLAGFAYVGYDLISFRRGIVQNLSIEAQIIGSNCVSALLFDDRSSAETTLAALRASPHIVAAAVYTADGKPFAAYWRDGSGQTAPIPPLRARVADSYEFRNGRVTSWRPIIFSGRVTGFVSIESDLQELNQRIRRYVSIGGVAMGLSLLAALLPSFRLRRAISDPIVRLADAARTVRQDKDYSIRAAPTGGDDEIATLVISFNEMLAEIQARDAALLKAKDELEARVQERTQQLTAANKELEAFTYSVSHDLRAPLRQVDGFTKILTDAYGSKLDAAGQRYLRLIREGAKNMGALVDDLLNLSRLGRRALSCRPVDLANLVEGVRRDLEHDCPDREIEWQIASLPTVICDPALMKQVFVNLLSNAVKYTRPRPHAIVTVGQETQNGEMIFSVKDNGVGFDQNYAHKLFAVFQRLHRMDEFEGTGVGLAIVQTVIQKHGGRVWAKAELGKGADFFFALPVNAATSQPPPRKVESSHEPQRD